MLESTEAICHLKPVVGFSAGSIFTTSPTAAVTVLPFSPALTVISAMTPSVLGRLLGWRGAACKRFRPKSSGTWWLRGGHRDGGIGFFRIRTTASIAQQARLPFGRQFRYRRGAGGPSCIGRLDEGLQLSGIVLRHLLSPLGFETSLRIPHSRFSDVSQLCRTICWIFFGSQMTSRSCVPVRRPDSNFQARGNDNHALVSTGLEPR